MEVLSLFIIFVNSASGTYFLKSSKGQNIVQLLFRLNFIKAIFKPYNEEPYAPKNPRGYIGRLRNFSFIIIIAKIVILVSEGFR